MNTCSKQSKPSLATGTTGMWRRTVIASTAAISMAAFAGTQVVALNHRDVRAKTQEVE